MENRAAITEPAKIGALLRSIDDYVAHPTTLVAPKLSPLIFGRGRTILTDFVASVV